MSTLIGGFFSTLDIMTNAGSFHKAQAAIFSITEESQRASEAMDDLQEKMKKAWGPGFPGGGGLPPGKTPLALPSPEGPAPEEKKEEEKREKKKDYLQRLASLYALYKLMKLLADMAVGLAKLTYAMTQGNMKSFVNSIAANMSSSAVREWSAAARLSGQNAEDLIGAFTEFNKAFVLLKMGQGDAFGQYATAISILGKASGANLDPARMIGMSNDERIKEIMNAAKELYKKDTQLAIRLISEIFGEAASAVLTGDMVSGSSAKGMAEAIRMTTLTGKDVEVARDISLSIEAIKEALNFLGQTLGRTFHERMKKFNDWFIANKSKIMADIEAFVAGLDQFVGAIEAVVTFLRSIDNWFSQINEKLYRIFPFMDPFNMIERINKGDTIYHGIDSIPPTVFTESGGPGGRAAAYAAEGAVITINVYGTVDPRTLSDLSDAVKYGMQRSGMVPK